MSRRALALLAPVLLAAGVLSVPPAVGGTTVTCAGEPVTQEPGTSSGDVIIGTEGDDVIHAGGGPDNGVVYTQVDGGGGNDTLIGGSDFDELAGGDGEDVLKGRGAGDYLGGGPGVDELLGGRGDDWAYYYLGTAPVRIDLAAKVVTGEGKDVLTSIEGGYGSAYNDVLLGSSGRDELDGGGGDDVVRGRGGADALRGGVSGSDTLDFGGAGHGVTVDLSTSTATGQGSDMVSGFEIVVGTSHADKLSGDNEPNDLRGGGGNDKLLGRQDDDTLRGGGGDDLFDGGRGTDGCFGGAGTDTASLCEATIGIP
jgi:Ca2+-binding RTX toxin-like protein